MADDLELLVRSIEGEGPSPEFVTSLRERIVAETSMPTVAAEDNAVVEIDLRPNERETIMKTHWKLVGLAVAAIALIVGFVAVRDDDGLETVGRDGEATTSTVTPTTEATTGESANEESPSFVADATPLTVEGVDLEEGTYRVDTIGTPFSLTLDQPLTPQFNREGRLELSDPAWSRPADRDIEFMRLTALSDPTQPTEVLTGPLATLTQAEGADGWPADDFAGWLENLDDGVLTSDVEETTLGGRNAIRVDLELGDIECPSSHPFCALFGTNGFDIYSFNPGSIYRIWMVDQGDEAPVAVVAGIIRESDVAWFDTAEDVLSTLAFGEVAPNPVLSPPAGPIELPLLGGIRMELVEDTKVIPGPLPKLGRIPLGGRGLPGEMEFLANPLNFRGEPLETADIVERLQASGEQVIEVESAPIGGIDTRVFDIVGAQGPMSVTWDPDSNADPGVDWFLSSRSRVWLVEHPDRDSATHGHSRRLS